EIEERQALEKPRSLMLRHATEDADAYARITKLVRQQLGEPTDDPLLRMLTNRAGVHQNHVGFGRRTHFLVPMSRELTEHQLAVGQVHLTTETFDVYTRTHGKGVKIANGAAE